MSGDAILRKLEQENIDHSAVVRIDGMASPISAILVQSGGERAIVNYRDDALAKARCADPERLVENVDALLIDNRFPEFSLPIAQAAKKVGQDRADGRRRPDARNRRAAQCLHACRLFLAWIAQHGADAGFHGRAERASRSGRRALLAVTDGANGSWWHDGRTVRHIAAHPIKAIDTLGAGDVFHGACVLMLAEGYDFEQALRFSAAAAAIKCTRFGGVAGAPSRQEVEAFLASGTLS